MSTSEEAPFVPIRNLKLAEGKEKGLHKILQTVVSLDNGRYGYVYRDLGPFKNDKKFMCNVCKKVILFSKSVISHNAHPAHKLNLKIPMQDHTRFSETRAEIPKDAPALSDDDMDIDDGQNEDEAKVIPGEPVPPGLEDVVGPVCQIQAAFDAFKSGPLVGLEYIVELISSEQADAEPRYICLLCEKKGDPRSVMVHVTSYNHYLKYICCFFRTVGNKLNLIPKTKNRSAINTATIKVAEAIEKSFGRLQPFTAVMETFTQNKSSILKEIDEKEHFRETPELNFLELVTPEKLEEYTQNPVVNFNMKDLDLKNEELTKKCLENIKRKENYKKFDKAYVEEKAAAEKSSEDAKKGPGKEPLAVQNPPKKLCIALNKPERSIPGISKPQVQNSDIIVKKEPDSDSATKENKKDDDDVIILADSSKDPVEVHSLSSVSSRSRSWSRGPRNRRSRSPRRSSQRSASRRSRSKDRFGRTKRNSRESSYDRSRRDRSRDRNRSRDRDRRLDDRGRRGYEDRRRLDRGDSRGRRGDSRGRHAESRYRSGSRGPRRANSRPRRPDSREKYDRSRYDDKRRADLERNRDRNPSPVRYKNDHDRSAWRDRNHESEERAQKIAEEIKRKNVWHLYKEELSKLEDDLEKTYKFYQSNPEKHPSYNEEWKAFWNRRYKEIQMSGQDPSKYDFKPEWILFWEKKMKEIHDTKVITEKETLKRKHNLDDLQDMRNDRDLQDISPPTPETNKDVTVNDIKKTWKALTGSEITAPKRATSPWEPRREKSKEKDVRVNDVGMTSQQFFAPSRVSTRPPMVAPVPPVVHCLRMLSVLEHQIGFQASRVIELLAQALAMEKMRENHSGTLLQNKDIFLFFEAMKEKLRGQLMAGIVQRHLVSATRNVIKTIESMLEANPLKKEVFEPVSIPGVGDVDKVAVAQKIAGALIKMGKINVSQEELEQLINAVVGMATASSVSADVSSDKFFSQLNIKNSNASSHINNILNSLIQTAQQSELSNPGNEVPEKNFNSLTSDLGKNETNVERGPSPFSLRSGGTNPLKTDEKKEVLVNYDDDDDDDDDDYSFEDVYTAASEKLKKTVENPSNVLTDENSQTQSSLASVGPSTTVSGKNSSDILSSLGSSALSNIAATLSNQSKDVSLSLSGLNSLSTGLNLQSLLGQGQPPPPPPEKPSIDLSLVESIKDTLVQSFTQGSNEPFSDSSSSFKFSDSDRHKERATLDPRNRGVWDPSIRGYDEYERGKSKWDELGSGRPGDWEERVWGSESRSAWVEREREGGRAYYEKPKKPWELHPWEPGYGPHHRPPFGPFLPPYGRPPFPPFPPRHPADPHFRHPPFY